MRRLVLTQLLFAIALPALGNDFLQFDSFADMHLGSWNGIGAVAAEQTVCIASANTDRPNPPSNVGGQQAPYFVTIENIDMPGTFALFLDGNAGQPAEGRIDADVLHEDLLGGSAGLHDLTAGIAESELHTGQFKNCTDGVNARFRIAFTEAALMGRLSGSYSGDFAITVTGGASGTLVITRFFRVTIDVTSPRRVRIAGLDDVNFGSTTGTGPLVANDPFCVYSETGAYRLTASSADQGVDGGHYLAHETTSGLLTIAVTFDDGSGPQVLTNLPVSGSTAAGDIDCSGLNNASLTFAIDGQDLQAAPSGRYSQTLILTVAPE